MLCFQLTATAVSLTIFFSVLSNKLDAPMLNNIIVALSQEIVPQGNIESIVLFPYSTAKEKSSVKGHIHILLSIFV